MADHGFDCRATRCLGERPAISTAGAVHRAPGRGDRLQRGAGATGRQAPGLRAPDAGELGRRAELECADREYDELDRGHDHLRFRDGARRQRRHGRGAARADHGRLGAPGGGMTPTLGHLAAAAVVLERLAAIRLPAKSTYALAKLLTAVQTEVAIYHTQRNAAIQEFGTPREATPEERATNGGGQSFEVAPDRMAAFVARLQEFTHLPGTLSRPLWLPLALFDDLE